MRCIADLHAERSARRSDAEVLVAEPTHQIEGLLRRLLLRHSQCVRVHLRFDRRAHVRCGTKVPIRRHRTLDALMRSLEVVVLDEERQSPQAVREVREHRLAQKLLPQRLPEALDLPECLGVLRSALAVRDAVAPEQLLKLRLATPRGVLPSLIRQHLLRLPVLGNAPLERLDHQTAFLVVRHRPRHEVPRVVVHEADQVHALVAPQLEREDVALPELVGRRPLEAPRWLLARRLDLGLRDQAGLVQDAAHRRLRHAEPLEASEHVPDATRAPRGIGLPRLDDRALDGLRSTRPWSPRGGTAVVLLDLQRLHAAAVKQRHELLHHRGRHPERHRGVSVSRAAHHRLDDPDTHRIGHDALASARAVRRSRSWFSFLPWHLFSPSDRRVTGPRTTGAMRTSAHETAH